MVSRVPGSSDPVDVNALSNLSPVQNQNSGVSVSAISLPNETVSKSGKTLKYSTELIAGIVVLGVALAIVAIALTILAPGVPQSIVLAIAFSGISVGGVTTLRSLINGIKTVVAPRMTFRQRAKSAALLGAGLTGAGLVLKLGSSYIPGDMVALSGNLGIFLIIEGVELFAGFAHYSMCAFSSQKSCIG